MTGRVENVPLPPSLTQGGLRIGMPSAFAVEGIDISRNHLDRPYVTRTFQKIGAPNLRTSWTFFRKAVGWTHCPHGTYVTSLRATFWTSSASCFLFVSSVARTHSVTSFSSCGTSGQPNQARGPAPDTPKWTAGLMTSKPSTTVEPGFHPPCPVGSFAAATPRSVAHSIGLGVTLNPLPPTPWAVRTG